MKCCSITILLIYASWDNAEDASDSSVRASYWLYFELGKIGNKLELSMVIHELSHSW